MSVSRRETIAAKLTAAFSPIHLVVTDDSHRHAGHAGARPGGESHFSVEIVSEAFAGKSRVDRHRLVNAALSDELVPDGVHALAVTARAPAEWQPQ